MDGVVKLYVLPGDGFPDVDRAIESFGEIIAESVILPTRRLDLEKNNPYSYFAYVLASEYLDAQAREALPCFLENGEFDCLVLMQPTYDLKGEIIRVRQSPRVFRSGVSLREGLLIPTNPKFLRFETLLDGWLHHA